MGVRDCRGAAPLQWVSQRGRLVLARSCMHGTLPRPAAAPTAPMHYAVQGVRRWGRMGGAAPPLLYSTLAVPSRAFSAGCQRRRCAARKTLCVVVGDVSDSTRLRHTTGCMAWRRVAARGCCGGGLDRPAHSLLMWFAARQRRVV